MTKAEADKIITAEVKAILARGEPLSRLLDDHVRAGLYTRHPRLAEGTFLPHDSKTIYDDDGQSTRRERVKLEFMVRF